MKNGKYKVQSSYCNRETRQPEVALKDGLGVENAHVTQEGGRVDGMEERRMDRGGNMHVIMKIKMSIVKGPIREGGTSEQGGTLIQSCQLKLR